MRDAVNHGWRPACRARSPGHSSSALSSLCYHGHTMPTGRRTRTGRTEKISISLDRSDLAALKRRARQRWGGNLSAAIAEGARRIKEEEGREALVKWLGAAGTTTPEQRNGIRAEWAGGSGRRRRRTA